MQFSIHCFLCLFLCSFYVCILRKILYLMNDPPPFQSQRISHPPPPQRMSIIFSHPLLKLPIPHPQQINNNWPLISIWCFPSTGLVVGVMVQHFGPRNCGALGAVLFSMGLVLSAFVTSIGYLIVSFGIISGKFFFFIILDIITKEILNFISHNMVCLFYILNLEEPSCLVVKCLTYDRRALPEALCCVIELGILSYYMFRIWFNPRNVLK